MATYMNEEYGLTCRCGMIISKEFSIWKPHWNYCPMCGDTTERDDGEE